MILINWALSEQIQWLLFFHDIIIWREVRDYMIYYHGMISRQISVSPDVYIFVQRSLTWISKELLNIQVKVYNKYSIDYRSMNGDDSLFHCNLKKLQTVSKISRDAGKSRVIKRGMLSKKIKSKG